MNVNTKIYIFSAVFTAALLFSSCTPQKTLRTVSVNGTGSITIEADNATIVLSVITRGKDVAAVSSDNAAKMKSVQDALISKGIQKENITTEHFSLHQESSYEKGKTIHGEYVVTNEIHVFVKNISQVSEVIDTAIKNGANQLSSLSYGVNSTEIAEKQAKTLAIQQAQESALLLAGASGAKLGKIISIVERNEMILPKARMMKTSRNSAESFTEDMATPISGGKTTITVYVDTVFELK